MLFSDLNIGEWITIGTLLVSLAVSHAFLHWKVKQHDTADRELKDDIERLYSKVNHVAEDVAFLRGWAEGQDK